MKIEEEGVELFRLLCGGESVVFFFLLSSFNLEPARCTLPLSDSGAVYKYGRWNGQSLTAARQRRTRNVVMNSKVRQRTKIFMLFLTVFILCCWSVPSRADGDFILTDRSRARRAILVRSSNPRSLCRFYRHGSVNWIKVNMDLNQFVQAG